MRLKTMAIMALTILLVLAVNGCTSAVQGPQPSGSTSISDPRQSSEGSVFITAQYKGNSSFEVWLDTHSGSLDYQLDKIAYVKDSKGNAYRPLSWDGGSGGHHISGTLRFPKFDDSPGFQLVVENVSGVKERALQW